MADNYEVEELRTRVAELERRVELLFINTGAMDVEKVGDIVATDASPEVAALVAAGDTKKAIKLYQEQSGLGLVETMAALSKLKPKQP